jgi:hypothetical protein
MPSCDGLPPVNRPGLREFSVPLLLITHHALRAALSNVSDRRRPPLFLFLLLVVQKVDGVLFQVSSFVVLAHDQPDVFVPGHTLHLTVGEAQIQRPRHGRPPQVVERERLFGFIDARKAGPAVDDPADVPGRERSGAKEPCAATWAMPMPPWVKPTAPSSSICNASSSHASSATAGGRNRARQPWPSLRRPG